MLSFKVTKAGVVLKEANYTYDALGRRIEKRVFDHTAPADPRKTFTRRYVYDGEEILLEYDGSNNLLARYTHSGLRTDDVLSVNVTTAGVSQKVADETGTYQYLKDAQGTIVDIADNSGTLIQHYVYSAFGTLLGIKEANAAEYTENVPLGTSFTYTGREHDSESGLFYYRARYYDPGTGRFLQKDPEPGKLNVPAIVVNAYTYVVNNPLNLRDPMGRSIFGAILSGLAIIGATIVFGPAVLGALAIAGGISAGLTGAITGDWSLGNLGSAFLMGAGEPPPLH